MQNVQTALDFLKRKGVSLLFSVLLPVCHCLAVCLLVSWHYNDHQVIFTVIASLRSLF